MPLRRLEQLRVLNSESWSSSNRGKVAGVRRSAADPAIDQFARKLTHSGTVMIVGSGRSESSPQRGASEPLQLEMDGIAGTKYVLMARHEDSQAIDFRLPEFDQTVVRRGQKSSTIRFTVPTHDGEVEGGERRGVATKIIKWTVMKLAGIVADKAMPFLGKRLESHIWEGMKLEQGWKRVTTAALQGNSLPKVKIAEAVSIRPGERNLLFLHGTFSHAASAFRGLATTSGSNGKTFFEGVQSIYGNRIFAFDHFSFSLSLEENARALLDDLPSTPCQFDVVTHSRGGLVLRTVVEEPSLLPSLSGRFSLGHGVLVASPNEGTPLATPARFDHFLKWIANVTDYLPDNPFTTAVDFVSEGLLWLAHHVVGALPGLSSMDARGRVIAQLQGPPGPPPLAYSALVASYEPERKLWQRMVDTGVDVFFGSANDLVVPTEGGWRVDAGTVAVVPGDQIGCFGHGGNLEDGSDSQVTHVSFFTRPATVDFLVEALQSRAHAISVLDPDSTLPYRGRRGMTTVAPSSTKITTEASGHESGTVSMAAGGIKRIAVPFRAGALPPMTPGALEGAWPSYGDGSSSSDEVFYLSVLGTEDSAAQPTLLANFRNARVMATMQTGGGTKKKFQSLEKAQREIDAYVNGGLGAGNLGRQDLKLVELGKDLFETLFPDEIKRLYDVARSTQPDGRLHLIFSSMVSRVASLPWEFAYDPERKNFLSTSEVNFTRNVETAIPADLIGERDGPLRILVAVAQPLGLAHLSVEEETGVIRSGFKQLIDDGLAEVDVVLDTTPRLLHETLQISTQVSRPYDILHFIGHGEYDEEQDVGYLVFENEQAGIQKVDSQVLQQILSHRGIRLMFLNACETGKGGKTDFNRGVAPALVAAGVPTIVANQYSVLDVSAASFARHFYWALAQGAAIGDAAREARVSVNYSISGEAIDWAVPVVFTRNPSERLSTVKKTSGARMVAMQNKQVSDNRKRRGLIEADKKQRHAIALWDVHHAIPHLDRIAQMLTEAQTKYYFRPEYFTAPMDTWQRHKSGKTGVAYLLVEKVVERLRDKPEELGVERLIAITNFPLRDKNTVNIFAWDNDPEKKVSIFSTYELLDKMAPPRLSIERMIANAIAFFIGALEAHKSKPKNCAFYYNEECDIQYIAGELQVCEKTCRPKLRKRRGSVGLLEKFLGAYPVPGANPEEIKIPAVRRKKKRRPGRATDRSDRRKRRKRTESNPARKSVRSTRAR